MIRKLLPVLLLLCALLAACTAPAGSPNSELGGLTRVSLKEPAAGCAPAAFLLTAPPAAPLYMPA